MAWGLHHHIVLLYFLQFLQTEIYNGNFLKILTKIN